MILHDKLKKIEDKLQHSEQRYRSLYTLFNNIPMTCFRLDNDGTILSINRFGAEQLGYTADQLEGQSIYKLVCDNDIDILREHLQHCVEQYGLMHSWEMCKIHKDGNVCWMRESACTVNNERGKPEVFLACRDYPRQKHSVDINTLSSCQYKTVFNTLNQGIYSLDLKGTVTFVNASAEKLLGRKSDEMIGRNMHDLIYYKAANGKAISRKDCKIYGSITSGTPYSSDENIFWRKDGSCFPAEVNCTPLYEANEITGAVVTFRDISDRNSHQNMVRISRTRLRNLAERMYSAREQERAAIAREIHDIFGQYLTALKIDLGLIRGGDLKNHKIDKRIYKMIEIVDDMISQTKTISSRLRPAVLDDLGLEAAIEALAAEFEYHFGCQCMLELNAEELVPNPERDTAVYRIVQEALTNAARHAKASIVQIVMRLSDDRLTVLINDNGIGITEDAIDNINSIGLFGMRERAGVFGGRVSFIKNKNDGTTVKLIMPIKQNT